MLSQIQAHAASLLEDLDSDEAPPESEMEAMGNSLDSMIETFREIKAMIEDAMNNFRRRNLLLIRTGKDGAPVETWQAVQISIVGTDVWRRLQLPVDRRLEDLHRLIQICMNWKDSYRHRFFTGASSGIESMDRKNLDDKMKIKDVCDSGMAELLYEYGNKWSVNVIMLSLYQPGKEEMIRCVAGEGAAPPEIIGGPLRFRKILHSIANGSDMEKQAALHEIGPDFVQGLFDMESCNNTIHSVFPADGKKQ
jgi:hypothetical protein